MVAESYMTRRRQPPSPAKTFLHQTVIPAAIDAAAVFEGALARAVRLARASPLAALAGAFLGGLAFSLHSQRRR